MNITTHPDVDKILTVINELGISVDEAIRRIKLQEERSCSSCKWFKLPYCSECAECEESGIPFKKYERD